MVRTFKEYTKKKLPVPLLKILQFVHLRIRKFISTSVSFLLFRFFYAFPEFTSSCAKNFLKLEFRDLLSKKQIFKNEAFEILLRLPSHVYSVASYFYDKKNQKVVSKVIDQLVLKIKDAVVYGSSNVVSIGEKESVYDLYALQYKENYKYTDACIKYINKNHIIKQSKGALPCQKGILLSGNYSWNYYHLTIDILPKFYYINKLNIDSNVPLIIDEVCMRVQNFMELIEIFNTKPKRKIIVIEKGEQYIFEELFFAFQPNFCPPNFYQVGNISIEDFYYDYNSLNFVRSIMLGEKTQKIFPRKIFISRSQASQRREFNEDEVYYELKKYGFVKICPENYSVRDQVAMFNGASWVAGGGGAAYTNLLYSNNKCKALCFTNYSLPIPIFPTIASISGADLVFFNDKSKVLNYNSCIHDSYNVDVSTVVKFLNKNV